MISHRDWPADAGEVTVRLPSNGLVLRRGADFFAIDVVAGSSEAPWRVWRRYSEFLQLAQRLALYSHSNDPVRVSNGVPFPRKHMRACKGERLENRRAALEAWLSGAVARAFGDGPSLPPLERDLQLFLLKGRAATPVSLVQLPEPTALALPVVTELVPLEVQVPQGCGAGSQLSVLVPNNRAPLVITVPWGLCPGTTLHLWYDLDVGTLGVAPLQEWQALRS